MISLLDLLRRIDAGTLSTGDAIALSHDAIRSGDGEVRAFVALDPAAVAAAAGPLRGIAVGVKDIIDTADLPTAYGSPIYAGWRPKADAALVSFARRAGATIVGKTATTAFAHLDPAATRNPRNLGHTPGGSSSGSAAAVAAGMAPLAFGTQTAGSVIRPASFCGVAGVKPSYRILPTPGIKPFSWSLDTPGLFAASVADAAFALAALTGRDGLRIDGRALAAPRIGVVVQDFAGDPEPAAGLALERAARLAERAGAGVRRLLLPPAFTEAFAAHAVIQNVEARQALAWEYDRRRDAIPPLLRAALDAAQAIPMAAYDEARRSAHHARGVLAGLFDDCDVILTFAAPGAAPPGLGSTGDSRFNRLWTLMGNPCIAVPGLTDEAGLPVGVQVIAAFGKDRTALEAAAFVEAAIAAGPPRTTT